MIDLNSLIDEKQVFSEFKTKLEKLSESNLISLKTRLRETLPEMSWLNKAQEAAVLIELFIRTGEIDQRLLVRTYYSVEDLSHWEVFYNKSGISNAITEAKTHVIGEERITTLFLSSKLGAYVSSQEYVYGILNVLKDMSPFVLASEKQISPEYSTRFKCFKLSSMEDYTRLLDNERIRAIVDLTGNHNHLTSEYGSRSLLIDVWGAGLPGSAADFSVEWAEMSNYKKFLRNPIIAPQIPMMYLTPESEIRKYPEIAPRRFPEFGESAVILGAFCRTSKLNLKVIRVWSEILIKNPETILLFAFIQSNQASQSFVKTIFGKLGVSPNRILFCPRLTTFDYLDMLNSVDINLGAMPEQGGLSCMDSLFMGCPYVVCTELSNTYTASIVLRELGLDKWIFESISEYKLALEKLVSEVKAYKAYESRLAMRSRINQSSLATPNEVAKIWHSAIKK